MKSENYTYNEANHFFPLGVLSQRRKTKPQIAIAAKVIIIVTIYLYFLNIGNAILARIIVALIPTTNKITVKILKFSEIFST